MLVSNQRLLIKTGAPVELVESTAYFLGFFVLQDAVKGFEHSE